MRGFRQTFIIDGLNIERLLEKAADHGIVLDSMQRTSARQLKGCVGTLDFPLLATLAQEGGWQIRTGQMRGIGALLARIRRRRMMIIGLSAAMMIAFGASLLLWRVEIYGAGAYEADLRQFLAENGVTPMQLRSSISLQALREKLIWRYPDVSFIECVWRGTVLQVHMHEGVAKGDTVDISGCNDVIAARDGIVISVITASGTPAVQPGQIVRRGQVLIKGNEQGRDGSKPVAANGTVLARVWDQASASVSIHSTDTSYTGRKYQDISISTPWFSLWPRRTADYEHADIEIGRITLGGLFLPFTVTTTTYHEAELFSTRLSEAEARAQAEEAALRLLQGTLPNHDEFIDKWVEYSMIENETIIATAYGERVIDIAAVR